MGIAFFKVTFEIISDSPPPYILDKSCAITGKYSWANANTLVNALTAWRLPTEPELAAMGQKIKDNDDIYIFQKEEHPESEYIWTSTTAGANLAKGISLGDKGDDLTSVTINKSTALARLVLVSANPTPSKGD